MRKKIVEMVVCKTFKEISLRKKLSMLIIIFREPLLHNQY